MSACHCTIARTVDARAIAKAMRVSARAVRMRAAKESWPSEFRIGVGGPRRVYTVTTLPAPVREALLLAQALAAGEVANSQLAPPRANARSRAERVAALWQRYERCGKKLQAVAGQRLRALQAVEALEARGLRRLDARARVAAQLQAEGAPVSVASLGRWADLVAGLESQHRLAALVPDFCGRTVSAVIDERAWDLFKADYLRLEQPSMASCYERLERIAADKGWVLPSLRTLARRIENEIPRGVRTLRREGTEALERTYPAQERDRAAFHAIEAVNADGHKFDVFVRNSAGAVVRPILVGVQDLYSGKLLGWRLAETESSDLIRLAFRDVVEHFGVPSHAWLDNGRGFASKYITGGTRNRYRFKVREDDPTGILVALGMQIHWTTPYHGQAKPIERAWRDLCDRIAKHPACAGAYTGNTPDAKPENYGSRAVPWAQFAALVDTEIAAHNARPNRKTRVCGGTMSFDEAFAASYASATIRRATPEQLRQLLLTAETVTANRQDGSVRLADNRYWHEALCAHAGRKLLLRFDPANLHQSIHAYTLDNTYICAADCIGPTGFSDTDAAREHLRGKKQYLRAIKDQANAAIRMDAARVAAQLPDITPPELPAPTVIAPLFGQGSAPRLAPGEPAAVLPLARTGTEDRNASLDQMLEALQRQQMQDRL